jgi:hypothetical protein
MDGAMAQRVGRTWDLLNSRFEFGLRRLKIRKSRIATFFLDAWMMTDGTISLLSLDSIPTGQLGYAF